MSEIMELIMELVDKTVSTNERTLAQLDSIGLGIDILKCQKAMLIEELEAIILIAEGRGGLYETICNRAHKALEEVQ